MAKSFSATLPDAKNDAREFYTRMFGTMDYRQILDGVVSIARSAKERGENDDAMSAIAVAVTIASGTDMDQEQLEVMFYEEGGYAHELIGYSFTDKEGVDQSAAVMLENFATHQVYSCAACLKAINEPFNCRNVEDVIGLLRNFYGSKES